MGILVESFDEPIHPSEVRKRLHNLEENHEQLWKQLEEHLELVNLLIKLMNRKNEH